MKLNKRAKEIDGINIVFFDNEFYDKKIIFFVHGWGADKSNLASIYNSLINDYRIISLDLPGFGESEIDDTFIDSFSYARLIDSFFASLKLDKVTYVGHSFGGKIGIILAGEKNKIIDKLVLIDSSGIKPKRGFIWHIKVYSFKLLKFFYMFFVKDKDKIELFKSKFGSTDYKNAGRLREILVKNVNEDLTHIIKKIDIPTFIYWGEKDRDTPLWMAKKIKKLISDSGIYIVKDGEHFSFLKDNRIVEIIKSFVGE